MHLKDAWLLLAQEHFADRTYSSFLCLALEPDRYCADPSPIMDIPESMRREMIVTILHWLDGRGVCYTLDEGTKEEQRDGRVLGCLMFAAMEDE